MPTFKKIDRNRFRKVYPVIRGIPRPGYMSTKDLEVESAIVPVGGNSTITYTFKGTYSSIPTVVATPADDDVNVYISSITLTSVVLKVSAPSSGSLHIQVILT